MKQKLLIFSTLLFVSITLSAQTHYPIHNPAYTPPAETEGFGTEKIGILWNAALNQIKQEVNANDQDFKQFSNFYKTYIDSTYSTLNQLTQSKKINPTNAGHYIDSLQQKLKARYSRFLDIKSLYPSAVEGYKSQTGLSPAPIASPTCNTACTNMDFSNGTLSGWYGYYGLNNYPAQITTATTAYNITIQGGGYLGPVKSGAVSPVSNSPQVHITTAGMKDAFLSTYASPNSMSEASPWGSGYSVMLGDSTIIGTSTAGGGGVVGILSQEFEVTPTTNSITYAYSVFLENPSHFYYQQPFFNVTVFDQNGDTIPNCGKFDVVSGPGLPGFKAIYWAFAPNGADTVYWKNWTQVNVPLKSYIGQCVTIQFEVTDCERGGHFGYAYVDASCAQLAITASSNVMCANGTIILYGPAGESGYQWIGPPTNSILTSKTLQNVTVDSAGTYTLVVTPATGAACKDTIYYTVSKDLIAATATGTNISCFGGSNGTATATGIIVTGGTLPFTYSWAPSGQTTITATGLKAGSYTVTVKDANGCSGTASVMLTQPTAVKPTIVATTGVSCNGGNNGTATATAGGGTPPYTYLWTAPGGTTATGTGFSAGVYTVTATDNNGCTGTTTATITQPTPVTAKTVMTQATCGASNGTATATGGGGTSPYTYSWAPYGGSNALATGLSAGSYTATVTDANICTTTSVIVVTNAAGATITITPANVSCNGGNNGSAKTVVAGGTSPYTYAWSPIGGTGPTGLGLTAGTYTLTLTDHNGCTTIDSTTIMEPTPLGTTISFTPASCNLSNGSATVNVTGGTSPYTYSWSTVPAQTTAKATGIPIGTYTVNIKDNNGCKITTTVIVTEPSAVIASIPSITNVSCNGGFNGSETAGATGGTTPYTYLWEPGGSTNVTAPGLAADTYTVTIKDNNGCSSSASAIITQPPILTLSLSGPASLCAGAAGTLTAAPAGGTSPYTYSWSTGSTTITASITPVVTATYSLTLTDANGCLATGQITVTVGVPYTVNITGLTAMCPGGSTTLCANILGGTPGYSYTWQPGNYTTPCIFVTPSATTTYNLSVIDGCQTTETTSATVQINPVPHVAFSANPYTGCIPLCIQFYNNTTVAGGGTIKYEWQFGNGDTALNRRDPIYCYPDSGFYNVTLTATSDSGCSFTLKKNKMIHAFGLPKAAFAFSPQPTTILSPTIQFTDQTTDKYGISYWTWNFGDKTDSVAIAQNASHTYQDTGTFCPNLVVVDPNGCTDTVTNCLVVDPIFTLYIPSAFTPNGDGIDELFMAKGSYIKSFEMYIFDRWGQQLYHTTNLNDGWNGTIKGGSTISQEDVYVYKITATDWENHQHSYIGSVTLIR